jgi:elongation factor Ts
MEVTMDLIKELRERTGVGLGAVKEALGVSNTIEEAINYLREKGLAKAAKRAGREANQGTLGVYVHTDKRLAVIVEVATETDFAARSADVQKFASDVALHIAAVGTEYVNVDAIPAAVLENETNLAKANIPEGKPAEVAEKIVQGRLDKFYKETVLAAQTLFTDENKTVGDYLNELVAKVGEKIEITRFVKVQIAQPAVHSNIV